MSQPPTLNRRTTTVVIWQGDDLDELAQLRRAVDIAERNVILRAEPDRLGDPTNDPDQDEDVLTARRAYNAFVDEASERAVTIRLEALGRRQFRDLAAKYEPRKDESGQVLADDAPFGVNIDAIGDELLPAAIVEPVFDPRSTDCQRFLEDLAEGDYARLIAAAVMLNKGVQADPKDSLYSLSSRTSTES